MLRVSIFAFVLSIAPAVSVQAFTGREEVVQAVDALAAAEPIEVIADVTTDSWTWTEVLIQDETYPLTVDLLGSNFSAPEKIVYMLPGGNSNFRASFFAAVGPGARLAQYLREHGYLVVGITPREDMVPADLSDYSFMADWGIAKHTADIRKIVEIIQNTLKQPYDLLGHSFGAVFALDYAAKYSDQLERIILLDIDSTNPITQPEKVTASAVVYDAYNQLLAAGRYADTSLSSLKQGLLFSLLFPNLDSGESREAMGLPGNFTIRSLMYFTLVFYAMLPGVHTPISGLPGEWHMIASLASGEYSFDADPQKDTYALYSSDYANIAIGGLWNGSATLPIALPRDWAGHTAYNDSYNIDWAGIQEQVFWINTELGYADQLYGADLIRASGNPNVTTQIVPGYGHMDILYANDVENVWQQFAP